MNPSDYGCVGMMVSAVVLLVFILCVSALMDIRVAVKETYKLLWNETEGKRTGVTRTLKPPAGK